MLRFTASMLLLSAGTGYLSLSDRGSASSADGRTPGLGMPSATEIPVEVLERRRAELFERLTGGIAVIRGADRKDSSEHPQATDFRQDNSFYYLTGVESPGAWLVLFSREEGRDSVALFVPKPTSSSGVWTGAEPELKEVSRATGVRTVLPASEFDESFLGRLRAPGVLREFGTLHLPLGGKSEAYRELVDIALASRRSISDLGPAIAELRIFKDSLELTRMRRAIAITIEGQQEVMRAARPGLHEYELEAVLEYVFRLRGAERVGFPSIVGSGPNSVVLHHDENRRRTRDGDLVVVDAGAEVGYYTADLTRTFPVNGRFNPRQRQIYQLVLATQKVALDSLRPGVTIWDLSKIARRYMRAHSDGACGEVTCDVRFVHLIGHWLGMEVHDVGNYAAPLAPGMVLTIEPGIYLPDEGLGVRIEDVALVTEDGHELLSAELPREMEEIEALMREEPILVRPLAERGG